MSKGVPVDFNADLIPSLDFAPAPIAPVDIAAPVVWCLCGGEAASFRHRESLLHLTYSFRLAHTN